VLIRRLVYGAGNAGLLDQVLALRWIEANIHHLGGDPSRLTLLGQFAARASARIY
jgi:carboxylesterase type B